MGGFKEIVGVQVLSLIEHLKQKLPDSVHAYCFLRTYLHWKSINHSLLGRVYAPDGDSSDETFLLYINFNKSQVMTVYSSSETGCLRLKEALEMSDFIDWKIYFLFTSIPVRIYHFLDSALKNLQIKTGETYGTTYWMPSDKIKALSAKTPESIEIKPVSENDAELINSIWPHREEGSVQWIKEFILVNFGLGAYKKDTGELVSWGLHWFYGGIGVVQTVQEEQGKGYCSAVTVALCKQLDKEGWPVHLIVVKGNPQGNHFFEEKLKFSSLYDNVWIHSEDF